MSACSGSASFSIGGETVEEAAEKLIAGDMADQIGLGELTPACPEVEEPEVGTTFQCTAVTSDGQTIDFDGVVDEEDHINLETTNVVTGSLIEQLFYETLNAQNPNTGLVPDGVDCGGEAIVLVDKQMTCEILLDGAPAQTATLTITDIAAGEFEFAFEPTDTQEESTTTTEASTTDDATAEATLEEMARSVILVASDLGAGWSETPQAESEVDYRTIEGCESVADLVDHDGFLVEVDSSEFSSGDIAIEHSVRIYADSETATDIVLVWAEQTPIDCIVRGAEQAAEVALSSGELDPFEEIVFGLQSYEDHIGEPRTTNLELTNTLIAPDQEVIVINDQYFIQVGRIVSRVGVLSPNTPWESTPELLEIVADRMAAAAAE
ncbi:MAG: hypothetical protein GY724_18365 [Actinomycetia bacterium]|nr:hypothetical protein [Actinomycetes bacterium]MCP4225293.1 hypothetical protein [Actinomycetes bacterium]MCP5035594.1 hypothetical protein [Actinomycetes bacterium]